MGGHMLPDGLELNGRVKIEERASKRDRGARRVGAIARLGVGAAYVAAALYVVFCLAPILFMVLASLKSDVEIFDPNSLFIFHPTTANYEEVLTGRTGAAQAAGSYMGASTGPQALLASVICTSVSTLLALIFGATTAYGLARYRFKGSRDLAYFILSTRMAPPIAFVVPMYLLFKAVGLLDTYFVLIIVYTGMNLSFVVWLLRGFFLEIPIELEESALLDGYGRLDVFRKIALPLAKPGIIASGIFSAIFAWNEFLFAAILTSDTVRTLPVAITGFSTSMGIRWGAFMATAAVAIVPIFVLTVLLQRHLVRGLTFGAVK